MTLSEFMLPGFGAQRASRLEFIRRRADGSFNFISALCKNSVTSPGMLPGEVYLLAEAVVARPLQWDELIRNEGTPFLCRYTPYGTEVEEMIPRFFNFCFLESEGLSVSMAGVLYTTDVSFRLREASSEEIDLWSEYDRQAEALSSSQEKLAFGASAIAVAAMATAFLLMWLLKLFQ